MNVKSQAKKLKSVYGADTVCERHRHRYGFNSAYGEAFEKAGMKISAVSADGKTEAVELPENKFFIGVQFHPELSPDRSRRTLCSVNL